MNTYQEIVDREQKYLLNTYARYPLALVRGKGVYLYNTEGKRYLDFLSGLGVNALGHAHPRIVKVMREQAAKVDRSTLVSGPDTRAGLAIVENRRGGTVTVRGVGMNCELAAPVRNG